MSLMTQMARPSLEEKPDRIEEAPVDQPPQRSGWGKKFSNALRGLRVGIQGHSSFFVHFFSTALVIAAALAMGMSLVEWALLLVCVASVLTAEMFNSALESMARAFERHPDPHVGDALDIASAAVLVCSVGAAVVGALIFLNKLAQMLHWWD